MEMIRFLKVARIYRACRKYDPMGLASMLTLIGVKPYVHSMEETRRHLNEIDQAELDPKAHDAAVVELVHDCDKEMKAQLTDAADRLGRAIKEKWGSSVKWMS